MDFLRIAGNEVAANRWISFFIRKGVLFETTDSGGSRFYVKTELGQRLHEALRDSRTARIITKHLSGHRLRP